MGFIQSTGYRCCNLKQVIMWYIESLLVYPAKYVIALPIVFNQCCCYLNQIFTEHRKMSVTFAIFILAVDSFLIES